MFWSGNMDPGGEGAVCGSAKDNTSNTHNVQAKNTPGRFLDNAKCQREPNSSKMTVGRLKSCFHGTHTAGLAINLQLLME